MARWMARMADPVVSIRESALCRFHEGVEGVEGLGDGG
jgi:hypothetical protein